MKRKCLYKYKSYLVVMGCVVGASYVWLNFLWSDFSSMSVAADPETYNTESPLWQAEQNIIGANIVVNKVLLEQTNDKSNVALHEQDIVTVNLNVVFLINDTIRTDAVLNKSITNNATNDIRPNETGDTEHKQLEAKDNNDTNFDITDLDEHIYLVAKPNSNKQNQIDNNLAPGVADVRIVKKETGNSKAYRKKVFEHFYMPITNIRQANCSAIMEGDAREIRKAHNIMKALPRRAVDVMRYVQTTDCTNFKRGRGYIDHPLSEIERSFPLAFGIMVFKEIEQVERLLRAIYRPHNYYCFHIDSKTLDIDRRALEAITNCFKNVFISSKSVNVTWGEFSVLEAELSCMEELSKYKLWQYYINLTGQEYPLKTNRDIVTILKSMQGANIVDGTWVRARDKYFYRWTGAGAPPPHRIRPIKGSVHVAINREFVDFSLHDQRARDFLNWVKKTQIPDETFFASLNHNPSLGIKGSFLGEPEEYPLKPSFMRYKNWELGHSTFTRECAGKFVRNICILGVGDLHRAYTDIGLFANKFHLEYQYLALDCLEEVLYKKTWMQYLEDIDTNVEFYTQLDYLKYKLD